jgi:hypothetical protein
MAVLRGTESAHAPRPDQQPPVAGRLPTGPVLEADHASGGRTELASLQGRFFAELGLVQSAHAPRRDQLPPAAFRLDQSWRLTTSREDAPNSAHAKGGSSRSRDWSSLPTHPDGTSRLPPAAFRLDQSQRLTTSREDAPNSAHAEGGSSRSRDWSSLPTHPDRTSNCPAEGGRTPRLPPADAPPFPPRPQRSGGPLRRTIPLFTEEKSLAALPSARHGPQCDPGAKAAPSSGS